MLLKKDYIVNSIELNLFFGRIMREHCIFIIIGFPSKEKSLIDEGKKLKEGYECLLEKYLTLSGGYIPEDVYNSNELVTKYTKECEEISAKLTGLTISTDITKKEQDLEPDNDLVYSSQYENVVKKLNYEAINLTKELIAYKSKIVDSILKCKITSTNSYSLFHHIIDEAKHYLMLLTHLQDNNNCLSNDILKEEIFWDHILKEHCSLTKCLIDSTEKDFISSLDKYFRIFERLEMKAKSAENQTIHMLTTETLKDAKGLSEVKTSLVKSSVSCNLKTITLPLYFDHILRENNFYIKNLKDFERNIRFTV